MTELTTDAILGGRLTLSQPARGHRAGTDAILVAAAAPAVAGDVVADFGAGVGTVGLAVLARIPGTRAVLLEIDEHAAGLASANIRANGFAERAEVRVLDIAAAGLGDTAVLAASVDHVVSNPPYNAASGRAPPEAATARARMATEGLLESWVRGAVRVLKPGGSLTFIHRPDALGEITAALEKRFGAVTLRFIHGEANAPAIRVLVQSRKGSGAPLRVLPPVTLNALGGGLTSEADALHRDLAALSMA